MSVSAVTTPSIQLRDYQTEAIDAVRAALAEGTRRQLVSLSTGLGKTVFMAALPAALQLQRMHDVTLIVAHREELIEQTVATVKRVTPGVWVDVEKAQRVANPMAQVVVGSIMTLRDKRLDDFLKRFRGRIALFMIDEAHHAAAKTYVDLTKRILEQRSDAIVIGVTATPQRGDNKALSLCFDDVVFHRDIRWAIDNGYLVPITCYRVNTTTSLDKVPTQGGDYAAGALGEVIDNVDRNHLSVSAYLQHTPGKRAIAFTPTVTHAEHLAETFRQAGVRAAAASDRTGMAERVRLIKAFRGGEIDVLVNVGLYIEGFDVPDVEVIINARPTKSSTLFIQMVGRGLRPVDDIAHALGVNTTKEERVHAIATSRKPFVTILDVVDLARKLSIVTIPTVFGLPPNVDPQGEDILKVKAAYDAWAVQRPHSARQVAAQQALITFEQIKTQLEKVDHFEPTENDPLLADTAMLNWYRVSGDVYRLPLPTRHLAYTVDGNEIEHFDSQVNRLLWEAKKVGAAPSIEAVYDHLRVDRRKIYTVDEAIEIRPIDLDKYECWIIRNGQEKLLGKEHDFHRAIRRAERGVKKARPDVVRLLKLNEDWQQEKTSDGQIAKLRNMGVPFERIPKEKGRASRLIDQLQQTLGPTPGQVRLLTYLGVAKDKMPATMTAASALIDQIQHSRPMTSSQRKRLSDLGVPESDMPKTMAEASQILRRIGPKKPTHQPSA